MNIKGQRQRRDNKPFQFEVAWIMHEEFEQFLANNWKTQENIVEAINVLTLSLKNKNKVVFGNIKNRKRELLARIGGIQKAQEKRHNPRLEILGAQL